MKHQDLSLFRVPDDFRGRPWWYVQLWWITQALVFQKSPQAAYFFRAWLLRKFGAKVGRGVVIRPSVTITYPWKVDIGDHAWIGDRAILYSLGHISIGAHAVVSQGTHLCAGDHDYTRLDFAIRGRAISVGEQAWVAADVFVAPGISIGAGSVIGARSAVLTDMPPSMVCAGSPCRPVKPRGPSRR